MATTRFGKHDWVRQLAREAGICESQVRRWLTGDAEITGRVENEIRRACK